jgi:cell division protein FtsB
MAATAARLATSPRRSRAAAESEPRAVAAPTPRPPLRIVPAARRRVLPWILATLCGALFVGMLALSALQARIAQDQLRLDHLDQELRDATAYYDRLRLAVAQLESPEYVVPRAKTDLAMSTAPSQQYFTPTVDQVHEVLVAAGTEPGVLEDPGDAVRPDWGEIKQLADAGP